LPRCLLKNITSTTTYAEFVHSSFSFIRPVIIHTLLSAIDQPSQFLNNVLDHRIRPSLDLQPLRQRQSLDVRVEFASPRQDCVALLGRPHRGRELEIEELGVSERGRKRGIRTTTSGQYCSRIEGAASGPFLVVSLLILSFCRSCLSFADER
jgi:hypothetical protein